MDPTVKTDETKQESRCKLTVSEDKMAVLLSCSSASASEQDLVIEEVRASLQKMGIKRELDEKILHKALQDAKSNGQDILDLIIVKGQQPEMPLDEKLEWTKDFFAEGYYVDPKTKAIDYRQKAALLSIKEGDVIARISPAKLGVKGYDVFNIVIKVPSPKKVPIRSGPNVVFDEKTNEYKARCSGRLCYKGSTIDVMNIYTISGDIGTETGNIHHNGEVQVKGDVVSNFKIESEGNIEVKGVVGACDIFCGGDLIVKGGVNGSNENKIIVKGDAKLKYSDNAFIECIGNIHVDVEIHHSTIYSSSKVYCDGIIVGGKTVSAKGITVAEAGSKSNTKTTIIAGVDYQLLKALKINSIEKEKTKKELKDLEIEQKKITKLGNHLKNEQKEALTEIQFRIMEAEERIADHVVEDKRIIDAINENRSAQIEINDVIYQGTILKILDSEYSVEDTLKGPLVARIDSVTKKIGLFSNTNEETE